MILASALSWILPLLRKPALAKRAYVMALQCALFVHGSRAVTNMRQRMIAEATATRAPTDTWRERLALVANVFPHIAATTDFQYSFATIIFFSTATTRPVAVALIPTTVLAIYHVVVFFNGKIGQSMLWRGYGGNKAMAFLRSHQQQALMLNAQAEVVALPLLLIHAFAGGKTAAGYVMAFAYAQYLRLRYKCADARRFHVDLWNRIYASVASVTNRVGMTPLLDRFAGYLAR